ncbi:MAG: hypothetical protein H0V09_04390, partial [Gemmatimonadetes bacterium]|nr:hypothetical protein [Gemmatimonadota bacterium]
AFTSQCSNIVRQRDSGRLEDAALKASDLIEFVLTHAGRLRGGEAARDDLVQAVAELVGELGSLEEIGGATGGEVSGEDHVLVFPPGWSSQDRIVFSFVLPGDFQLDTDLPEFAPKVFLGTFPEAPFDEPVTVGLCASFSDGEGIDPSELHLAKNIGPFPGGGIVFDGVEVFLPQISVPGACDGGALAAAAVRLGPESTGAARVVAAGKGGGRNGIALAGRLPIGGLVSSFTPFGVVRIGEFTTCSAGEGLCLEDPVVSIGGNTLTLGAPGALEAGQLATSVHGAALRLPPAGEYAVTVRHDLCTWDSYNPATDANTGFFDSFSISVSQDQPYWLKPVSDPVTDAMLGLPGALGFGPLGGLRFGDGTLEGATGDGTAGSCSAAGGAPVTATFTMPGDAAGDNYLNIVLDTASVPHANHGFPSWGTVTVLSVDVRN